MGCDDTPEDLRERIGKLSQEVGAAMDLNDAERRVRRYVEPPVVIGMQHVLITLLAEYDRRGAALAGRDLTILTLENNTGYLRQDVLRLEDAVAEAHAEIARLRAKISQVEDLASYWVRRAQDRNEPHDLRAAAENAALNLRYVLNAPDAPAPTNCRGHCGRDDCTTCTAMRAYYERLDAAAPTPTEGSDD